MLFDLFKKKQPANTFTDKTYGNMEAKKRACVALASQDASVIFIAWFAETAALFKQTFAANQLGEDRIVEVRNLSPAVMKARRPVFLEHFPLRQKEEALIESWPPGNIEVFNALDEGLFQYFGGERILALMKQMGMQEDEVMEHPMISKSIRNSQDKLAKKIILEQSAHSQREWFKKNTD